MSMDIARRRVESDRTVQEAIALDPRVGDFFAAILDYRPSGSYRRDRAYEHGKRALDGLVGWGAEVEALQTEVFWVAAVQCLYDILPVEA